MVTGDAVVDWMPFLGDGYPEEWIETLNALEQVDFTHMILGHGEVAPKSHLTCFRNYLTDLIASVKQAAAEGATMTEMQTTVAEQLAPQYEQGMSKYPIGAIPGSYWADDRDRLPQGRSNALNLRGTKTRRKPS